MAKKHNKNMTQQNSSPENDVRFCLNCNDMDDLATSEEAKQIDQIHERFDNCRKTGRFDGDLCARLFVAEDDIDSPDIFAEEDEDA